MPQTGLCTDLTCDKEIKQLYECHCCSGLICLNHLIEHVEIEKRSKERLDRLSHELVILKTTVKLMIEKKMLIIEHENKLIEQAEKLLNVQTCSVGEMQDIFEQIKQAIAFNPIEQIIKVEPSSLDMNASRSAYKCDVNEKNTQHDQSSEKSRHSESKSSICLDLINDSDEVEQSTMPDDNEDSMCTDHGYTLRDRSSTSMKDERRKEDETRTFIGLCPLTFDGAYGFNKGKHSIPICSTENLNRVGLYSHFINKHKLKTFYARRLVQAVVNNQNPMTTKILHGNAKISEAHKISCPFNSGMLNLPENIKKNISGVPCGVQSIPISRLKVHLKRHHRIRAPLAKELVNRFTSIRMKRGAISV